PEAPPPPGPAGASLMQTQAEAEKRSLAAALADAGGNLTRAALSLGVSRQRLAYRMAKHGLDRKDFRGTDR
ncbi:MAG TPA: helix-turn-helix domain-containing protein, partial [Holophaga sp.]|nr:helix-turn-helix domain-containing protein [Holophaga sp.]